MPVLIARLIRSSAVRKGNSTAAHDASYHRVVSTANSATRHAGSLYRRLFAFVRHPVRKIEDEAHHLREVEDRGESGETPLIVFLGVILFILPIFLVMLVIIYGAYVIAGG